MTDIFGKILGIILAFILAIVLPLSLVMVTNQSTARTSLLNETQNFIDEVIDTKSVTEEQLEDFYLGMASYGPLVDVTVERYVRVINPDPARGDGYTRVTWMATDNIYDYNQGDIIKVNVKGIGYTGEERFIMNTLGFLMPEVDFSLAGRVR